MAVYFQYEYQSTTEKCLRNDVNAGEGYHQAGQESYPVYWCWRGNRQSFGDTTLGNDSARSEAVQVGGSSMASSAVRCCCRQRVNSTDRNWYSYGPGLRFWMSAWSRQSGFRDGRLPERDRMDVNATMFDRYRLISLALTWKTDYLFPSLSWERQR